MRCKFFRLSCFLLSYLRPSHLSIQFDSALSLGPQLLVYSPEPYTACLIFCKRVYWQQIICLNGFIAYTFAKLFVCFAVQCVVLSLPLGKLADTEVKIVGIFVNLL